MTNAPASGIGSVGVNTGSFISSWGGTIAVVVILVVVFALYYQTIGYYFNLGWEKLSWSKAHHEKVEIETPIGPAATLTPAPANHVPGAAIGQSFGKAMHKLESDVESALNGSDSGSPQVFNVSRNLYKFSEAEPLCRAFGAELATYDQVKDAYNAGADWCNYGWVKGQLSVYPTQQSTYDKLQAGPEDERGSCGVPGLNGGFFPNADQRFGVNCYGTRPTETPLDERQQFVSQHETAFDREVSRFRAELPSIAVNPWNGSQWSS
jgi:hypothetical protein